MAANEILPILPANAAQFLPACTVRRPVPFRARPRLATKSAALSATCCGISRRTARLALRPIPETPPVGAAVRAIAPLQSCSAPVPHNSAAAPQSASDNIAQQSLAAFLAAWIETPRAKAPASGHSNTAQSAVAAPATKRQNSPPSSIFAIASASDFRNRSRYPSYRAPATFPELAPDHPALVPAPRFHRSNIVIRVRRSSPNPASPSRPPLH